MDFTRYFLRGLKGTLRFNNGVNLSYKGPWVEIFPNTVIDEFYVGDFMSAEYTICVDGGNVDKEIIKCLVVAGPSSASITIYGRTSLQNDMINLSATVNDSKLTLLASPIGPESKKLIFSVSYYHAINDL
jgi:methionine synthase II (cobalamin-independent)